MDAVCSRNDLTGPACPAHWLTRLAWWAAAVAVLSSVLLALVRIYYNVSFQIPLQTITSGGEEESLFAIWKWVHDEPVYNDPRKIPFSGSYFNWAFYASYGLFTEFVLKATGFQDDWITQIAKWFTLLGTLVLGAAVWWVLRLCRPVQSDSKRFWSIALVSVSVYVAASPHMGFWAITARPDVWALAMEVLGLGFYVRYIKADGAINFVGFLLFAYLAWAFKHVNVAFVAACTLHCILRRRYKSAFLIFIGLGLAFALTLYLGTDNFRFMLLKSQANMGFVATMGIQNLVSALAKSTLAWMPWLATILGVLLLSVRRTPVPTESRVGVLHLAAVVALLFYLPLACKEGASDNYFLPFTTAATLAWFSGFSPSRVAFSTAVLVAGIACMLGCAAVLSGKRGSVDRRSAHNELLAIRQCVAALPQPVLVWGNAGSLPWINVGAQEYFVLASTYSFSAPQSYEHGGIEGLLAQGYFASAIDPRGLHGEICSRYLHRSRATNFPGRVYTQKLRSPG